jgi:hypothetical protein
MDQLIDLGPGPAEHTTESSLHQDTLRDMELLHESFTIPNSTPIIQPNRVADGFLGPKQAMPTFRSLDAQRQPRDQRLSAPATVVTLPPNEELLHTIQKEQDENIASVNQMLTCLDGSSSPLNQHMLISSDCLISKTSIPGILPKTDQVAIKTVEMPLQYEIILNGHLDTGAEKAAARHESPLMDQSYQLKASNSPVLSSHSVINSFQAPTLTTRTAEAVIADLKSGRKSHHRNSVSRSMHENAKHDRAEVEAKVNGQQKDAAEGPVDYESEAEEEIPQLPRQRNPSERKRAQNASFDSWFEDYSRREANKPAIVNDNDSENQSVKALLRQSEGQAIISSPREYQIELFERAKEQNIIAVLDTG